MTKTKLGYTCLVVFLSFLLGACSVKINESSETKNNSKESEHSDTVQWSYKGETGPHHWGELDATNKSCADGREQSPINLEFSQLIADEKNIRNIQIQYEPTPFTIINNGHTVQANAAKDSNHIVIEGNKYQLAQFHFHTPSEHQFNGVNFDMELHFVHKNAKGEIVVLGVMIKEGKENEPLASIWDILPKEKTSEDQLLKGRVDLDAILPQTQTSFHYNGSLTTPPCTEEVKWIIFKQPIEMSKEQIKAFQQIFPDNHRPVQPLNERTVLEVKE